MMAIVPLDLPRNLKKDTQPHGLAAEMIRQADHEASLVVVGAGAGAAEKGKAPGTDLEDAPGLGLEDDQDLGRAAGHTLETAVGVGEEDVGEAVTMYT